MKYRYFAVRNSNGELAYVQGEIILNGQKLNTTKYDSILWIVSESDREALNSEELKDKNVLVIYEEEFMKQLDLRKKLSRS